MTNQSELNLTGMFEQIDFPLILMFSLSFWKLRPMNINIYSKSICTIVFFFRLKNTVHKAKQIIIIINLVESLSLFDQFQDSVSFQTTTSSTRVFLVVTALLQEKSEGVLLLLSLNAGPEIKTNYFQTVFFFNF